MDYLQDCASDSFWLGPPGPSHYDLGVGFKLSLLLLLVLLQSLWPLPAFSTTYLATIHIFPQHRHCEGLSQEINIPLSCLSLSVCIPQIDYLHKYTIFYHCQLFPQYTWPQLYFTTTYLGIVKNSHTKIQHPFPYLPCPCVAPPKNLIFAQLHNLWPMPTFLTT